MSVKEFVEGFEANMNYEYYNPYQDDWGSDKKGSWNDGWEHARKVRLVKIEEEEAIV